uniref:Extensin-like n=1 Tax=Panagrellus redivivus TaxID=6233 RepID=A0A7E4UYU6_PANRE
MSPQTNNNASTSSSQSNVEEVQQSLQKMQMDPAPSPSMPEQSIPAPEPIVVNRPVPSTPPRANMRPAPSEEELTRAPKASRRSIPLRYTAF